jgi:hypothetical protein
MWACAGSGDHQRIAPAPGTAAVKLDDDALERQLAE